MNLAKHRMAAIVRVAISIHAALAMLASAPDAGGQSPPPSAAQPAAPAPSPAPLIYRVNMTGDLLFARSVDDFRAQLAAAAHERADYVLLSISGRACRADVLLAMMHAILDSPVPVVVELTEQDTRGDSFDREQREKARRVHTGLLALGIASPRFAIKPNLRITNLVEFPSLGATWDASDGGKITDELIELTAAGLSRRGVPDDQAQDLARAILTPVDPLWLTISADRTFALSRTKPPAALPLPIWIVRAEHGDPPRFELTADQALMLRCADARVGDYKNWLGWDDDIASFTNRHHRHDIACDDYAARAARAPIKMMSVDNFFQHIEPILDLPDPAKHSVSKDKYRESGRLALDKLKQTEEEISDLEAILRDFPEVLRTPPPGQTDIAAKPSSYAAKWRSMIQSRRDKLAKLRAKAEDFAAQ